MEHLVEIFEGWKRRLLLQRTAANKADPNLPRIPHKVRQIKSKSPNEIAHFVRHYKNPVEVIGKLSLKRPDFGQANRAKKKPNGS